MRRGAKGWLSHKQGRKCEAQASAQEVPHPATAPGNLGLPFAATSAAHSRSCLPFPL